MASPYADTNSNQLGDDGAIEGMVFRGEGFLRKASFGAGSFSDPFSMDKTECGDTVPGNTPPADLEGTVLAIGKMNISKNNIALQDRIKSWIDKESETKQVRRMDSEGEISKVKE